MYNAQITRNNPALITLLVDRSGSMADTIQYEGEKVPKSEVVTKIINSLIDELLYRCRKGSDHQNYFDIGIFGYHSDSVYSLLDFVDPGKKFFSVTELVNSVVKKRSTVKRRIDSKGDYFSFSSDTNWWTEAYSGGNTPTYTALKTVYCDITEWIKKHDRTECFPPIMIHISDGEPSDSSEEMLLNIADKIRSIETNNGNLIFLNVHLASYDGESIIFPESEKEIEQAHKNAKLLYHMSSDMPVQFHDDIAAMKNTKITNKDAKIKGVVYNASVVDLIKVLSVGTSTIR